MASFTKAAAQQLLLRTQEEVQNHFCPKLLERKAIYRKAQTAYLRRAELGETIITKLNNGKVVETTNTVKDSTSWIACGKTTMGEQYILTAANFEESYDKKSSKPIQINNVDDADNNNAEYLSRLVLEGFQEYSSKRSVYAHEVNNDDIAWLTQIDDESENDSSQSTLEYYCHGEVDDNNNNKAASAAAAAAYFIAPWGESMRVEPGDVLVMQYIASDDNTAAAAAKAINKEVYRIEKNAFSQTYREKSR